MSAATPSRNKRVPVTRDGLAYIVQHMRDRDRDEIFALRWDDDPDKLVRDTLSWCGDMCGIWEHDRVPVSILGAAPLRPGVWEVFAYGTDCWPALVLDMTKHVRRFIIPALLRGFAHRVECRALASHQDSRKWLTALGAREEATLGGFGRKGEDFVSYVWRPEDVQRWQQRGNPSPN